MRVREVARPREQAVEVVAVLIAQHAPGLLLAPGDSDPHRPGVRPRSLRTRACGTSTRRTHAPRCRSRARAPRPPVPLVRCQTQYDGFVVAGVLEYGSLSGPSPSGRT